MTQRHNVIQSRGVELIMEKNKIGRYEIKENCTVILEKFEKLKQIQL
jgi:hypothetical protein